jgi:DNA-binding transcriptional regulator YbjK
MVVRKLLHRRGRPRLPRGQTRARGAVIDIIHDQIWAEPRTLLLSYELYAFAARHPAVGTVMQQWMDSSRDALGRFFDPLTARALDALIEGIGIHNSIDRAPLDRDAIKIIVERIADC